MTSKEIKKYFDKATQGTCACHKGRKFVTREMMERDSIGHVIKSTKPKRRYMILSRTSNHMLRRPI
jgi:hypothetical protein